MLKEVLQIEGEFITWKLGLQEKIKNTRKVISKLKEMLRLFFICIFKCSLKKKYYYIEEFRTQRENDICDNKNPKGRRGE